MKKKILIIFIVVLVLLILVAFAGYLYVNYKVNKISLYFNDIQYTAAPSADKNGWYAPYFDSSVSYNKN